MSNANELLQLRQARLEAMRENKKFKDDWAENNEKVHKRNLDIKKEREAIDMKIKTSMTLKKKRQEELRKKVSRSEVFSGIEEFEKKLGTSEIKEPTQSFEKSSAPINTSITSIEKPEKDSSNTRDANTYLKKIKAKRSEEHASRKEKEQRRRKVLMEQQQVFKDLEESRRREVLLEKLMKKSMEERQLAKELNEIKQLKQVMKENREIREKQYAERRRKDFEEKQKRETDLMEKEKEERKIKKRELIEKHKLLLEEKSKQKREKHLNICCEVVNQIIDLSFKEIEYTETTEGERPTIAEVLEWRKMFVKGVYDESSKEDNTEIEQSKEMEQSVQAQETVDLEVIDIAEFKDYFLCKGLWKQSTDGLDAVSSYIKDVVTKLHDKIHPLPSPKTEPVLKSKYPYNVILTGKPMSGKTTVCKKLASQLSLFHINADATLKSIIGGQSKATEYLEIANRARSCLLEGKEIDQEIIVDLLLTEIEKVEKIETPAYQGWLIEGYPLTIEAAKILERRISGYTSSIEEFVGTDSEIKLNSVLVNQNSRNSSDEELMKRLVPFKAFTSVIFIDIEDEIVFERLADQKVDPLTGTVYHMTFSPPESIDISSRLVPIDEYMRLDRAHINSQLVSFAKSKRAIVNWYKKFGNVFEIKDGGIEELVDECSNAITQQKRPISIQNHIQTESDDSSTEQSCVSEKKELDIEFCKLFLNEWNTIEQNYVSSCKLVFRNLREFRKSFFRQFSELKEQFLNFLLRPDDKQVFITQFQNEFNKLPLELRSNSQVKDELHRRSEDLKESLWTLCDEKKYEAEKELEEHQKESWLKTHKKAVIRQFMQLLQVELNRFIEQSKFLFDYYVEQYFSTDLSIGATVDPKKNLSAPILSVNIEDLFVDVISGTNTKSTNKKPTKPSTNSSTRSKGDVQDQELSIDECFERAKIVCDSFDLLATLQTYIDKNGKKKKEKTKDPYSDIPSEMRDCMSKEKDIFLRRITLIKETCLQSLKDQLESKSEHIFGTMRDWIGQRYRTDMANINLLSRTIQDYIEKETPIINEIRVEGNKCILDESVQMTSPLPLHSTSRLRTTMQEAPETMISLTKSFTPHQVFSLYERLQAPSPSGFVELEEITTTLLILIDSTFGSMELPNQWLEYDNDKVREITKRFDPFKKGYINWRTFLLSALFTFFHRIPTIEDIRKLLLIVHPMISAGETNLKQEQFNDILVKWLGETSISSNEEEVSKVLFNIFKPFINATVANTVNIRSVLLYLCLDNQSVIGTLTKGFEVLSYLNGTEGLDENGVFELMNFCIDVEEDVEDSFSLSQIRAVFAELKKSKISVSLEEFSCASIGKTMLKQSIHLKLSSVFY